MNNITVVEARMFYRGNVEQKLNLGSQIYRGGLRGPFILVLLHFFSKCLQKVGSIHYLELYSEDNVFYQKLSLIFIVYYYLHFLVSQDYLFIKVHIYIKVCLHFHPVHQSLDTHPET